MATSTSVSVSLRSRGVQINIVIAVALLSVIPMLTIWLYHLQVIPSGYANSLLGFLALFASFTGYWLLRNYPANIVKLRSYLEDMVEGEMPESIELNKTEDDISAIEHSLNMIIGRLKQQINVEKTEKNSLQQQLYRAQKMESMGMMAAGVAHDFNNVIAGIRGHADLLDDDVTDPEQKELVSIIQDLTDNAGKLTQQMLTFAGKADSAIEIINPAQIIRDMLPLLKTSVPKTACIESEIDQDLPDICADQTQFRQIIMNLVINAGQAMENPGSITVSGTLLEQDAGSSDIECIETTLPAGKYVEIKVSDTGKGISQENLEKIFDPFFSTKSSGHGLGLAIIQGIVHGHQGHLQVESEMDKGTEFTIFFPVNSDLD